MLLVLLFQNPEETSRAETLLCSRWTTVWIEGVHLALCSTPLFFLTSGTCVYASVSPAFHLCSALKREAPVGRVSAVTVSGRSNSSHRGAAFQTFCSRCVLKSQRRVGCLGRWEWFCCRLRPTFMTQHAHWRLIQTWCRSVIDVCGMEWSVWISDPDYTAEFLRTRTDPLLLKEHFVCSDFEFHEFCLMFHFTLLPSDGFAFDEAPDSLTIGSSSLISCHNAAFFAFQIQSNTSLDISLTMNLLFHCEDVKSCPDGTITLRPVSEFFWLPPVAGVFYLPYVSKL